ncbi:16273_t:CDS:2, partial [Acaulospora colombiana]
MGDLEDPETEHSRYNRELNNIIMYYDKTTEIGKMALKWKEDFKASIQKISGGQVTDYYWEEDDAESIHINIGIEDLNEEINSLNTEETEIRNALLAVLDKSKSKDSELGKTVMNSNLMNGIVDLTDADTKKQIRSILDDEQRLWLEYGLKKQVWTVTPEFEAYCGQFTEDTCNRRQVPNLVRKTFVAGRFDPFFHEVNSSVRLEAPNSSESKASDLERTFAIDTIVYIMNRLFKMHQDVLDLVWVEIITANTKTCKFDGVVRSLQVEKKNPQTIGIVEFSRGKKASKTKDIDDQVKLGRNAVRALNKLLEKVPCRKARVYTIQCVNGRIHIRYMVRPLPSIYLYDEFACIKLPRTFDDMEQFSMDIAILMDFQTDVLKTVKSVNKSIGIEKVYKSEIQPTPKKQKKTSQKDPKD